MDFILTFLYVLFGGFFIYEFLQALSYAICRHVIRYQWKKGKILKAHVPDGYLWIDGSPWNRDAVFYWDTISQYDKRPRFYQYDITLQKLVMAFFTDTEKLIKES